MLIVFYLLLMVRVGRCTGQIFETKTVVVGQYVKLTCSYDNFGGLVWIRQASGNLPVVLRRAFSSNSVDPDITATEETGGFVLRLKNVKLSDAAVYYCMKMQQIPMFLKGVDLRVEGPEPDITTVPPSDPVTPGDSVTPQCPVLSDSENKARPGEHTVCCFTSGSHQSHPSFSSVQGNSVEDNDTNPDGLSAKKCTFSFFRNVSSSDAGTYVCAEATCGEIFCGNGSKPNSEAVNSRDSQDQTILTLLCTGLAISLIVIAFLLYSIKKLKKKSCGCCSVAFALETNAATTDHQSQQTNEESLVYSTPTFSSRKSGKAETRDAKPEEEESIYTEVKALALN
ncbi:uncharacterized protein LOC143326210 [Chaetodon auriga]|uniref:uncharacterized protein LOC143326210 n=1 Tax=Chaetodon auriga TaxID=39042 RepID=UPI0040330E80